MTILDWLLFTLYRSSLFLRLMFDFGRGLSRWRRELSCFRFCLVWFDQINLLSRVVPRYLVDWWSGICLLLHFSEGHSLLFSEQFTDADLSSLILIFQSLDKDSILLKRNCKCWDAISGNLFDVSIAVLSANEARWVWFDVGISEVEIL